MDTSYYNIYRENSLVKGLINDGGQELAHAFAATVGGARATGLDAGAAFVFTNAFAATGRSRKQLRQWSRRKVSARLREMVRSRAHWRIDGAVAGEGLRSGATMSRR